MKSNSFICALPKELPAFICNHNGDIIMANETAVQLVDKDIYGKNITDYMSHKSRLQYEISMNSKKPRPFTAAAKLISGFPCAIVAPCRIFYCSFATVILVKNMTDAENYIPDYSPMGNDKLTKIVDALIARKSADSVFDDSLFDAETAISHMVHHFNDVSKLPNRLQLDFTRKYDACEGCFCDCGLLSFVNLFTAISYMADEISENGKATICVSQIQDSFEIKLETVISKNCFVDGIESLDNLFPSCKIWGDVCSFISQSSGCSFNVTGENNSVVFTVDYNTPSSHTDFKSNDPYIHMDYMLQQTMGSIETIYKEGVQE